MSEMRLTVRHTGKGSGMECTTPQGVTMTFDDPDTGNHGASPMQHLLAAIGACALVDADIILRKKRLSFSNLRVECVGARRDEPFPRLFTGIKLAFHVDGDVPAKVFEDTVRLSVEKYCSVGGTVSTGAPIAFETHVAPKDA